MLDFTGQTVIIAGATGNLGQAVTRTFDKAGATLVLLDRRSDRLSTVFPELVDKSQHLLLGNVDATQPEDVQRAVHHALEHFEHIDILANTVGGYRAGAPVHKMSLETWDQMLTLNARSALVLSQAVIPPMQNQGKGKIVHVASRAALKGSAKAAAYSASKSALIRLVESMSGELRSRHINVNCVMPGTIDTPENREAMPKADFNTWVSPEAIADVILFLASDLARAIHGAALPVYGLS